LRLYIQESFLSAETRRDALDDQQRECEGRRRNKALAVKQGEEALSALEHGGCEANLHRETDEVGQCRLPPVSPVLTPAFPRDDPMLSPC
jgi:hypothetical protein